MTQIPAFFALQGGLNIVTPAIRTPSGHVIAASNYEPLERGYHRIDGFERFDGQTKPSEASYWVLNFDAGTAEFVEGETVTGAGGATGVALIDAVVESGSYGGSDADGYLVLTEVSGTFNNDEALTGSIAGAATADGTATQRGADNDTDDTTWIRDAIETARTNIATVPGSGRIRGVWVYDGDAYAFRDNAGGTACVMFKATTAGWVAQDLGYRVSFDTGTGEISAGNTVTGLASGASGTVTRVAQRTGAWDDGDAAGQLIFASISGGPFQNGEQLQVGAVTKALADGASEAITLPAGGHYECLNKNFYGASNLKRMYGVNGVGTAFEWDGTVFVPIVTGMTTDTPNHIHEYKKHLVLSFPGGSSQNSSTGNPYEWDPLTGAAELGIGENITGYSKYAKSLIVFGHGNVSELYGNDTADFVLDPVSEEAGGVEWTVQVISQPIYLDDQGIRKLTSTPSYGDFSLGTISEMIAPLVRAKKKAGITATASVICRTKGQYRLFYSDNTAVTIFLGRKNPECMPQDLGMVVRCACSSEDSDGNEIMLFGSDDGYVYELDAGTSFDGEAITAFIRLPFNHVGSPTQEKRWHSATLEIDADASVEIGMTADYAYADPDLPAITAQSFTIQGGGGFWDESNWDEIYWSAPVEGKAYCDLSGLGENVSITVISEATYEAPHTIHGITLHYSPQKLVRRTG